MNSQQLSLLVLLFSMVMERWTFDPAALAARIV
jgi:hypothetical protein